ncbi:tRNA 2-thiocytidine biosynthesis TtcA family protein [Enterocloster citroniae]
MADKKNEAPHVNIERSIIKQFRKEIWRPFVKGLQDYKMIQDGDKVAVCISGGKDSMLLAKCLQQLKRQSDTEFDLEFIVMDPGYHPDNRRMIQDNAALMNIPIRIFDADIFDIVVDVDQSPCYLCARMRRGYLYSHARELGCNKIALGHHFDDVIETILMGILYGGQINTMMPKLHSTNFEGMELIRPLYYVKEEDILAWRSCNGLHFLQCACRFTEQIAREQAAGGMDGAAAVIVHTSKRQEMKELIRSLRKNSPFVDSNIMKSVENINLDACLGYVAKGVRHHFMDEYGES